jgi:hypothetical protein
MPRLSVTPGVTLKSSDPFASYFSLYSVQFQCRANDVTYARETRLMNILGHADAFNVPELRANEKTTTSCYIRMTTGKRLESADISVMVSISPALFLGEEPSDFASLQREPRATILIIGSKWPRLKHLHLLHHKKKFQKDTTGPLPQLARHALSAIILVLSTEGVLKV